MFWKCKDTVVESSPESMPEVEPDVKSTLKTIIKRGWRENEVISESESYEETFNRFVKEAVILIKALWREYSLNTIVTHPRESLAEVRATSAFCVTKDLYVYTTRAYCAENPDTKRACFCGKLQLKSPEEEKRFVASVMAELPEGTKLLVAEGGSEPSCDKAKYSFVIELNME